MSTNTDQGDDGDLRALLHETAEQIAPHGSLEDIHARTGAKRRRVVPVLAAAAALALVVGGIGWMLRDDGTARSTGPAASPAGTGSPTKESPVYFLGDTAAGPRLFSETRLLQTDATDPTTGLAMDAANLAVAGDPADPDYRTAWPAGTEIRGMGGCSSDDCEIQITFAGRSVENRPAGMSEEVAALSVEQLVRTVQVAEDSHHRVFFAADTPDGTVRLDHVLGVDTTGTVTAGSDDDVLAPVQITGPANGEKTGRLVKVHGVAATFEANVVWEVLAGGDAVVKSGYTTARECCTLSEYGFNVELEPGTYTIVVHDTDESGEGRPVNQDTKEIIVE
ncbi:Gmad2 immunoglobulin-like domain-containing protein [Marmoricola sp. RAF53]|uniref:Gmad2 immunoglobulin-like domain-containing protein n=1 Tax=Marmoricola sp. RAF53 TaxID=3233059 RepID=UPI003F9A780C